MNTTSLGTQAERLVAEELERRGYQIIDRNWKRPICEIDIIASKSGAVNFIEVKYRSRQGQGGGLEYITRKKLKQLRFAAEVWVKENNWEDDYRLLAAAVATDGRQLILEDILEID